MKYLTRAIVTFFFFVALSGFNWQYFSLQPDPPTEKIPHYLLVLRYWGTVHVQQGDSITFKQDWVYLYEVYETAEKVLERVRGPYGFGEKSVIGCWRLTDDRRVNIIGRKVEKTEPVRIEERKWTEMEWTIQE